MDFAFIARDHMRMYLMATRPWICISATKKACERSLVADDEEKITEFNYEEHINKHVLKQYDT